MSQMQTHRVINVLEDLQELTPHWTSTITRFLADYPKLSRFEYELINDKLGSYHCCIVGEAHGYDGSYTFRCTICRARSEELHAEFRRYVTGADPKGLEFIKCARSFKEHFIKVHHPDRNEGARKTDANPYLELIRYAKKIKQRFVEVHFEKKGEIEVYP